MHPVTAAIAAEILVVFAIFVGAVALMHSNEITNAIQQWGW